MKKLLLPFVRNISTQEKVFSVPVFESEELHGGS